MLFKIWLVPRTLDILIDTSSFRSGFLYSWIRQNLSFLIANLSFYSLYMYRYLSKLGQVIAIALNLSEISNCHLSSMWMYVTWNGIEGKICKSNNRYNNIWVSKGILFSNLQPLVWLSSQNCQEPVSSSIMVFPERASYKN